MDVEGGFVQKSMTVDCDQFNRGERTKKIGSRKRQAIFIPTINGSPTYV